MRFFQFQQYYFLVVCSYIKHVDNDMISGCLRIGVYFLEFTLCYRLKIFLKVIWFYMIFSIKRLVVMGLD